jgi:general secretion pathway protein G
MELRIPSGERPAAPSGVAVTGRRAKISLAGFTLIELLIVMSIIVILVSIAIPIYQKSILRTRETVLRNNLMTLRTVIDEFTYDKQKAPQSLEDLVQEGYLKKVPEDPITNSNTTWRIIMEEGTQSVNETEPGIFDVHSGSDKMGLDGTPYADW